MDSIGLALFTLHRRARSRTRTAEAREEERRAGEKGINVNWYIGVPLFRIGIRRDTGAGRRGPA